MLKIKMHTIFIHVKYFSISINLKVTTQITAVNEVTEKDHISLLRANGFITFSKNTP